MIGLLCGRKKKILKSLVQVWVRSVLATFRAQLWWSCLMSIDEKVTMILNALNWGHFAISLIFMAQFHQHPLTQIKLNANIRQLRGKRANLLCRSYRKLFFSTLDPFKSLALTQLNTNARHFQFERCILIPNAYKRRASLEFLIKRTTFLFIFFIFGYVVKYSHNFLKIFQEISLELIKR